MAVTAQAGIFGFGPQSAKDSVATTFYRHKAMNIDLGWQDDSRLGPLEIGSGPFPTFPYKAGYVIGGGAELLPRLEDTFGWLMYALLGDVSSAQVNTDPAYDHTFKPLSSDLAFVRWLTLRKYFPRKEADAATDLGEEYLNCKPVGMTFSLEHDQPIRARLDFLGMSGTLVDDISGWTWGNAAYESWYSVPVGCEIGGSISFTGGGLTAEELPIVRAQVSMQNVPLDLRQEKVYGSPYLEDVTIIERRLTFDVTVKWNNPQVYKAILTNDIAGTTWASSPLTGELEVIAVATKNIDDTLAAYPYSLTLNAPEIMWQLNGAPVLAAGQAIMMRLTGTALETAADYTTMAIRNGVAAYAWPV